MTTVKHQVDLFGNNLSSDDKDSKEKKKTSADLRQDIANLERKIKTLTSKLKAKNITIIKLQKKIEQKTNTLTDLVSNPNQLLLERSPIKIKGYSAQYFYENFIYTGRPLPEIKWTDNELQNQLLYKHVTENLHT